MATILCIDRSVDEPNLVTDALMPGVLQLDLVSDIMALSDVTRIGLMFHNEGNCDVPFMNTADRLKNVYPVINAANKAERRNQLKAEHAAKTQAKLQAKLNQPRQTARSGHDDEPAAPVKPTVTKYHYYTQHFIDFLTAAKAKFTGIQIDIISCAMNSRSFIAETAAITALTGVPINYSANNTGNGTNADWILESNSANLIGQYFTDAILNWHHSLIYTVYTGSALVTYMNDAAGSTVVSYDSDTKTYTMLNDFTNNFYFNILLNDGETFDGDGYSFYIDSNRSGIFIVNSHSKATTVKNLSVDLNNIRPFLGYLDPPTFVGGGGIMRAYQSGFTINNCSAYSDVQDYSGGICGSYCGNFDIIGCTFDGNGEDDYVGGIVASNCYDFTVTDCVGYLYSEDDYVGGIVGPYCKDFKVKSCIDRSEPDDDYYGGICGAYCTNFTVVDCHSAERGYLDFGSGGIVGYGCSDFTVERCTNDRDFNGSGVGGIIGYGCFNFTVKNCTNNSQITGWGSGGICGNRCANFKVINCTNNGSVSSSGCGGICGGNVGSSLYDVYYQYTDISGNGDQNYTFNVPDFIFDRPAYQYGRNIIEITGCVNNGNITSSDCGGIVGKYCGRIRSYIGDNTVEHARLTGNIKITITNCVSSGTTDYPSNNIGTIIGPAAGSCYVDDDYSRYGAPHTDIYVNRCTSRDPSSSLIGSDALDNDFPDYSEQNVMKSHSRIYINCSFTHNDEVALIGGLGDNVATPYNQIIYTDKAGNTFDLISDPNLSFGIRVYP